MIQGVVGYPGEGKTMFLSIMAIKAAERAARMPRNKRRRVFTNFPVYHEGVDMVHSWQECLGLYETDLFLMEIHHWFNALDRSAYGTDDLQAWTQSRHDGNHIWWDAQSPLQVQRQLREDLTAFIWRVRRPFGPNEHLEPSVVERVVGQWSFATKYAAAEFGKEKSRKLGRFRFRQTDHYEQYDSFYTIGGKDGAGSRAGRAERGSLLPSLPLPCGLTRDVYHASRRWEGWGGVVRHESTVPLDDLLTDYRRGADDGEGADDGTLDSGRVINDGGGRSRPHSTNGTGGAKLVTRDHGRGLAG
jgi:hypothetical protein